MLVIPEEVNQDEAFDSASNAIMSGLQSASKVIPPPGDVILSVLLDAQRGVWVCRGDPQHYAADVVRVYVHRGIRRHSTFAYTTSSAYGKVITSLPPGKRKVTGDSSILNTLGI